MEKLEMNMSWFQFILDLLWNLALILC